MIVKIILPQEKNMQVLKQWKAFGGLLKQYEHESTVTKCTMKFCIYIPPGANDLNKVPVLYFLPGLTCDDERMFMKAPNAMKTAANRGIAIVSPDTRSFILLLRYIILSVDEFFRQSSWCVN
jgi:S-formylglutathione hydrolase FrmB